jgi:hypothetical protein
VNFFVIGAEIGRKLNFWQRRKAESVFVLLVKGKSIQDQG